MTFQSRKNVFFRNKINSDKILLFREISENLKLVTVFGRATRQGLMVNERKCHIKQQDINKNILFFLVVKSTNYPRIEIIALCCVMSGNDGMYSNNFHDMCVIIYRKLKGVLY